MSHSDLPNGSAAVHNIAVTWLNTARLDQLVSELDRPAGNLVEVNQGVMELLLKGSTVEGLPGWATSG